MVGDWLSHAGVVAWCRVAGVGHEARVEAPGHSRPRARPQSPNLSAHDALEDTPQFLELDDDGANFLQNLTKKTASARFQEPPVRGLRLRKS